MAKRVVLELGFSTNFVYSLSRAPRSPADFVSSKSKISVSIFT